MNTSHATEQVNTEIERLLYAIRELVRAESGASPAAVRSAFETEAIESTLRDSVQWALNAMRGALP